MTPAEALTTIQHAAAARALRYSKHARERMAKRNVTAEDVRAAICDASACRRADAGRWKVTGPDLDDEDLDVVCAIEGDVIVVTVY